MSRTIHFKWDGNPDDYDNLYERSSSKSVEKRRSCGRLNIYKWTVIEADLVTSSNLIKYT